MSNFKPPFREDMTLKEAQDFLREMLTEGARCPCCTQHAQIYRWSLYATAVRALILYYRLGGMMRYVHSGELKAHGHRGQGDGARLRHWGLAVEQSERRDDGGKSGHWRVTELGERFLREQENIPKYVYVYNGRVLSRGGPDVSVRQALGKNFRYDELMAGV